MQFHITKFASNDVWPTGGYSLYQITGDQIADRVIREKVNPNGWYEGKITHRRPWCGFIGCYSTLTEVVAAIEKAELDAEIALSRA